jgi:NAD(P)-dependent dehydrogenase (short-subunit alcohol dehydrogenase family)
MTERIVITGANRGLGLAMARRYAQRGDVVVAGCRRPRAAEELHGLTEHVLALDVGSEASIEQFAEASATNRSTCSSTTPASTPASSAYRTTSATCCS